MIRPSAYILIFLSLSFFEGYSKKYLIETEEGKMFTKLLRINFLNVKGTPKKKADEHGADYYAPKPYGYQTQTDGRAVTCSLTNWGSWSSASATCGPSTQTRTRECKCSDGTSNCAYGKLGKETRRVKLLPCYACQFGSWTSWSAATATCGKSILTREQRCKCTDGVSRPNACGSGSGGGVVRQTKEDDHGPCTTKWTTKWATTTKWETHNWTPKPYRGKKRRMKRRRRM